MTSIRCTTPFKYLAVYYRVEVEDELSTVCNDPKESHQVHLNNTKVVPWILMAPIQESRWLQSRYWFDFSIYWLDAQKICQSVDFCASHAVRINDTPVCIIQLFSKMVQCCLAFIDDVICPFLCDIREKTHAGYYKQHSIQTCAQEMCLCFAAQTTRLVLGHSYLWSHCKADMEKCLECKIK